MKKEKDFTAIFSENLKRYLEEYEMSQNELARRLHVTPTSVSGWVAGSKTPRMDKVDKMCEIFFCRRKDLMEEKKSSHNTEQALIDEYTLDPKIRELVLYAGGIKPGEARDKYVGAVLLALKAMCESGKK